MMGDKLYIECSANKILCYSEIFLQTKCVVQENLFFVCVTAMVNSKINYSISKVPKECRDTSQVMLLYLASL